jgi:hypothetical protein
MFNQVFTSRTTNGDSLEATSEGGEVDIVLDGVFGGASVAVMVRFRGLPTFVPASEGDAACVFTAPMTKTIKLSRPCTIKLVISSAGGSTSLNAWI